MTLDEEFESVRPASVSKPLALEAGPSSALDASHGRLNASSSTLFGGDWSAPDLQFRAAALIQRDDGGQRGQRGSSTQWVTVFGYPTGAEDAVRDHFTSITRVQDIKYTPHNRMHLWCVSCGSACVSVRVLLVFLVSGVCLGMCICSICIKIT